MELTSKVYQMNVKTRWRSPALLAVSLALSLSAAANSPEPTTTVRFSPLQAATAAGAEDLYASLRQAAGNVCRESGVRTWSLDPAYATCVQTAVERAVLAVNIPAVSDLHARSARQQNL